MKKYMQTKLLATAVPRRDPLEVILAAQDGHSSAADRPAWRQHLVDYSVAMHEIGTLGVKQSCWMWYIWPSLRTVRKHSMPSMLLSFPQHVKFLNHDVLGPRLLEITRAANHQLQKKRRITKERLFGGSLDALKFHETCTVFAVAAASIEDEEACSIFSESLQLCGGLNEKVVEVLLNEDKDCENAQLYIDQIKEHLLVLQETPLNRATNFCDLLGCGKKASAASAKRAASKSPPPPERARSSSQ